MYLSGEGKTFGFKNSKINVIDNEDVEISDDIYNTFFKEQEKGYSFKVINKNGQTFDAIFEKITSIQEVSIKEV